MRWAAVLLTVASSSAAAEVLRYVIELPPVEIPAEVARCVCECLPARLADFDPAAAAGYGLALVGAALAGFAAGRLRRIRSRLQLKC